MNKKSEVKLKKVSGGYRIESGTDGSVGLSSKNPNETTTFVRSNQKDGSYKDLVMVSKD